MNTSKLVEDFLIEAEEFHVSKIREAWEKGNPDWEIVRIYRAFEGDFRIIVRRTSEEEQRWTVYTKRLSDGKYHIGFARK